MSQGKASIQIIGNVARDPETRVTQQGMAITRFTVAVNTKSKDREECAFIDCTIFDKRGEAFAKYHRKGSMCALDGRIVQDNWEDKKTGEKRSKLAVIVQDWHFVGSKPSDEPRQERQPAASTRSVAMSDADDVPF